MDATRVSLKPKKNNFIPIIIRVSFIFHIFAFG